MARSLHIRILPVLFMVLLAACSGSKPMAKRATKLEQAGLYTEAADMFFMSVQRNTRNVDAKIGLKRTGQQVLDDRLSAFFKAVNMGNDRREVVNAFLHASAYADRVQRMGVMLEIPDHHRRDFERVKGEHLVDLYERGQQLMEEQDFKGAQALFAEISKLEPEYKDAGSLQRVAYLEPLYRAGKADLEAGRYRRAFNELDQVVAKDPGFRDAKELRDEAIRRGQFTIAVVPFTSTASSGRDAHQRFMAFAITALTETKDPFIRVVDRENIDRILEEQRLGLSGVVDEQTAVRVGNLMGAQAVLMGTVIEHREEPGTLRRSTKDGFESYRVRLKNAETGEFYFETRHKPVKYVEFLQENRVFASFSFKLVSLETGEVLMSRVIDQSASDQVHYATYDGNRDALLPMRNGMVDLNNNSRNQLRSLLGASREPKSMAVLSSDLLRRMSDSMATQIRNELASKLP